MKMLVLTAGALLLGCGGRSYVRSDTALERVVVYRSGVAYFERSAQIDADHLDLSVPAADVDDFLKSLTVVDLATHRAQPIAYPSGKDGVGDSVDMRVELAGPRPHRVKLAYVTAAPAWKPSYRVALDKGGKVRLSGWAIVDNATGEDWDHVKLGVATSSALSFRFDLRSVRFMRRETLQISDAFAIAPPLGGATYRSNVVDDPRTIVGELPDDAPAGGGERLTLGEQRFKVEERMERMPRFREVVQRNVDHARASRDVVLTLCLNDKLSQLDVALRSARERRERFEAAARRDDRELANHEFTVINVLRQRVEQLTAEANQCMGQEAGFPGETVVTTTAGRRSPEKHRPAVPEPPPPTIPIAPPVKPAEPPADVGKEIEALAERLRSGKRRLVIEGYAAEGERDPYAASLARAERVRDRLLARGADPERVAAVGEGYKPLRRPGVQIVEVPSPAELALAHESALAGKVAQPSDPIGSAHFESVGPASVARGASAMIPMLEAEAEGEVVYLYDRESARGNEAYPFRAVRLRNPTGEALESGPVSVFGEGRFIGEGLCEPIPAHGAAFVPFALDRQIVVERKEAERDEIVSVLSAQRGVLTAQVTHTRSITLTLKNRQAEAAAVYVRHTPAPGYELGKAPEARERVGAATLFRVELPASREVAVVIEEGRPERRNVDVRSEAGIALVRAYLASPAADAALGEGMRQLVDRTREMDEAEQRIEATRGELADYRERMGELSAQVVALRAVKGAGGLLQHLEKKLREVSDKVSELTIALVGLEEKRLIARIRREEALSGGALLRKDAPPKVGGRPAAGR